MADDRVPLQGSTWPQHYKVEYCFYAQDEAGIIYVRPEHVAPLLAERENNLTRITGAQAVAKSGK